MPEATESTQHVKPFVYETLTSKALHFSICQTQSRMDLRDPHALDLEYTRTMMAFLLFAPQARDIEMIGLGGGSLAKFCHRHLPDTRIHVVEINPHVIALRDVFHVPEDSERFRVIAGDGAQYVRAGAERCDVLMVDGFDRIGQASSLCSQDFYDDAYQSLRPDGVMVVNLHSGDAEHASRIERIRRSFDAAVLVVDDDGHSNSIVFACKGPALQQFRAGVLRPPKRLTREANRQLLGSFVGVVAAWRSQYF